MELDISVFLAEDRLIEKVGERISILLIKDRRERKHAPKDGAPLRLIFFTKLAII